VRGTRKIVTVLFSDVASSTELGERLDPEAVRRVMERYELGSS
jgi:class 3 adenylate cyclase